jgi:hypothetical protein
LSPSPNPRAGVDADVQLPPNVSPYKLLKQLKIKRGIWITDVGGTVFVYTIFCGPCVR